MVRTANIERRKHDGRNLVSIRSVYMRVLRAIFQTGKILLYISFLLSKSCYLVMSWILDHLAGYMYDSTSPDLREQGNTLRSV